MSIFQTPTPPYQGQTPNGGTESGPSVWDQITSLFRTPTPRYKAPPPRTKAESADPRKP